MAIVAIRINTRRIQFSINISSDFLDFVKCPGLSKNTNSWFYEVWTSPQNPEIIEIGSSMLSHQQIEIEAELA